MHNNNKFPAEGTHFVCSATPHQQVDKHQSNETIVGLYIYICARSGQRFFIRSRWCIKLTAKRSACILYTPVSMSNSRHCSHSHSVISASIQSSQSSGGHKRWDWDGSCIVPRCCPTSSVLHLVLRDGQVTLGRSPSHSQSWCLRFHCLGQCNTTDSGGSCQKVTECRFLYICKVFWGTGYIL